MDVLCACDKKAASHKFVSAAFRNVPTHFFNSLTELVEKEVAYCKSHGRACPVPTDKHVDLMIIGPPCQPFSKMRPKKEGKEGKQGPATAHPEAHVLKQLAPQILERYNPHGFILEEVPGLQDRTDKKNIDSPTHLQVLIDDVTERGFHVGVYKLDLGTWCELPCERLSLPSLLGLRSTCCHSTF